MASLFRSVAEFLTPVLNTSQFYENGVLTPEEFVKAGDQVVAKCPTWQWAAGDPANAKPYLPKDKQFLITRNVPSTRRAADLNAAADEFLLKSDSAPANPDSCAAGAGAGAGDDGADDWVVTHAQSAAALAPAAAAPSAAPAAAPAAEEAIPDLDDFEFDQPEHADADVIKPAEAAAAAATAPAAAAATASASTVVNNAAVEQPRTYDLSICYDKRYRTPRVFLLGYAAGRGQGSAVLAAADVMQDVSGDHAFKTVTQEPHPHSGVTQLSIHPCRHSETMKRLLDRMLDAEVDAARERLSAGAGAASAAAAEDAARFQHLPASERPPTATVGAPLTGAALEKAAAEEGRKAFERKMPVEKYIFLFLKFIASVIPTIEYDYTIAMQL